MVVDAVIASFDSSSTPQKIAVFACQVRIALPALGVRRAANRCARWDIWRGRSDARHVTRRSPSDLLGSGVRNHCAARSDVWRSGTAGSSGTDRWTTCWGPPAH